LKRNNDSAVVENPTVELGDTNEVPTVEVKLNSYPLFKVPYNI
jgi:hypothetical protein